MIRTGHQQHYGYVFDFDLCFIDDPNEKNEKCGKMFSPIENKLGKVFFS